MNAFEATKLLDRSNIAEWPNPKPLSTERVKVSICKGEGSDSAFPSTEGFIRNANLHPEAHTRR
jgi:hypothetical protein